MIIQRNVHRKDRNNWGKENQKWNIEEENNYSFRRKEIVAWSFKSSFKYHNPYLLFLFPAIGKEINSKEFSFQSNSDPSIHFLYFSIPNVSL